MVSDAVLSVEELLARSAAAVKSGKSTANLSAVGKLLAARDTPIEDTVDISPVQKILQAQEADKAAKTNYFDSDDFLRLKISQLRSQLAIYTTVPGLDANGAIVGGIEAEIRDIIGKQQATIQESLSKADEAKATLDEQERLKALAGPTPEELLAKIQGTAAKDPISDAAQKLLDNLDITV